MLSLQKYNQIRCYVALFYGVLLRISPATFLHLKIQLEAARFEPQTFSVRLTRYQLSCPDCIASITWVNNELGVVSGVKGRAEGIHFINA